MNIANTKQFFDEWKNIASINKFELKAYNFFERWKASYKKPLSKDNIVIELNIMKFSSFCNNFPHAYKVFQSNGLSMNVWKTAKLKHDEVRNTSVLAWLFDKNGNHGQGSQLLERVLLDLGEDELASIVSSQHYLSRPETTPLGDRENRVDIEIEGKDFLIFIEAKIYAQETNNQLERYLEILPRKAAGRKTLVLYLTTNGKLAKDIKLRNDMKPISWKQIADSFDKHIFISTENNSLPNLLIGQFAEHIRSF